MVSCTSRRFQRWFLVDSELHTAQSYAHTVNNTVHTVANDAYAYDRMIFFGNPTVCEDPSGEIAVAFPPQISQRMHEKPRTNS
jgi:hypothetical protein